MMELLDYLREFNILSVFLRLTLAVLCGGLIGVNREHKRRPAGFRTYMMVCLGAALTMAVSVFGQMAASALVDHYGMFGVPVVRWSWRRLPPYLLILAGLGLMLW